MALKSNKQLIKHKGDLIMQLTRNMRNNLDALLAIALNAYYTNIKITKYEMMDFTFMCNFDRKVSLNHLKKINDYFNTDIRDKLIKYSLIVNKNTNTIKLHIEGIENQQISLLDNIDMLDDKIKDYDEKITKRLCNLSEYLYETIYPIDNEIYDWTFYYIAHNKKHIGFANADLSNNQSIKIYTSDFKWFDGEAFPKFYKSVDKYTGTKNDANVICLRRNYNSTHGSDWKPCIYGTPLNELWIS